MDALRLRSGVGQRVHLNPLVFAALVIGIVCGVLLGGLVSNATGNCPQRQICVCPDRSQVLGPIAIQHSVPSAEDSLIRPPVIVKSDTEIARGPLVHPSPSTTTAVAAGQPDGPLAGIKLTASAAHDAFVDRQAIPQVDDDNSPPPAVPLPAAVTLFGTPSATTNTGIVKQTQMPDKPVTTTQKSTEFGAAPPPVTEDAETVQSEAPDRLLITDVCQWGFTNELMAVVAAVNIARDLGRSLVEPVLCNLDTPRPDSRPVGVFAPLSAYFNLTNIECFLTSGVLTENSRCIQKPEGPVESSVARVHTPRPPVIMLANLPYMLRRIATPATPATPMESEDAQGVAGAAARVTRWLASWATLSAAVSSDGTGNDVHRAAASTLPVVRSDSVDQSQSQQQQASEDGSGSLNQRTEWRIPCVIFSGLSGLQPLDVEHAPVLAQLLNASCASATAIVPLKEPNASVSWLHHYGQVPLGNVAIDQAAVAIAASAHPLPPYATAPVVATWWLFSADRSRKPTRGEMMFTLADLEPRAEVLELTRFFIDRLGGPGGYVSGHVRLGDFETVCRWTPHPCGVNSSLVPTTMAKAAIAHQVTSFFIATDGSPDQVDAMRRGLEAIVPASSTILITLRDHTDIIEELSQKLPFSAVGALLQMIEKLIIACGKVVFYSTGSTFSSQATTIGRFLRDCERPRGYATFPTFNGL